MADLKRKVEVDDKKSDAKRLRHEESANPGANSSSDVRIVSISPLPSPSDLLREYPMTKESVQFVRESRKAVENILLGNDPRLLVVVGPCSIHNPAEAIQYGKTLLSAMSLWPNLFLVMRVYFEKPRTRVGWKGLIYDPLLDGSDEIEKGLRMARQLLQELTSLSIPIACEFLDVITPQYVADMVSWGAIGARTTECQVHRSVCV
jgi:3-deoxy-7-phosphoheptulonate synthase